MVERNVWDHYPTDEELAALVVDPESGKDQWDNQYTPIPWPSRGHGPAMICGCCERDFREGGWYNYAPQGRELFRVLVCPEHELVRGLMGVDEEAEVGAG